MIWALLISLLLLQASPVSQVTEGDTLSSASLRDPVRANRRQAEWNGACSDSRGAKEETEGNAPERVSPSEDESKQEEFNIGEIIFEHIGDEYEWHITEWKGKPIAIPLPCIVVDRGIKIFTVHHAAEHG